MKEWLVALRDFEGHKLEKYYEELREKEAKMSWSKTLRQPVSPHAFLGPVSSFPFAYVKPTHSTHSSLPYFYFSLYRQLNIDEYLC